MGSQVADLVVAYFNARGESADGSVIEHIDGGWYTLSDAYDVQACLAYEYGSVPVPGVTAGSTTQLFCLAYIDSEWQVVGMDGDGSCLVP